VFIDWNLLDSQLEYDYL
jgi:hypothetical protein